MQSLSKTFSPDTHYSELHKNGASWVTSVQDDGQALPLVRAFCNALEADQIRYCHWKSNAALDRSANGQNDLDLLVDRSDRERFTATVSNLGFKEAHHLGEAQLPGVVSYYGYDTTAGKLVHVHVHYQLVLGHDRTKNYRLMIEKAYLAETSKIGLFYVPTPEFEFVVFVLRMVLKYSTWDAVLGRQAKLPASSKGELTYLLERIHWPEVYRILDCHLPLISSRLFDRCCKVVQGNCTIGEKVKAGRLVQQALEPCTRRSSATDLFLKGWRRVKNAVRRRLQYGVPKARMVGGGTMIAIVGGDGAGKSTAIGGLKKWLAKDFDLKRVHLGKPRRSLLTLIMRNCAGFIRLPAKVLAQKTTNDPNNSPSDVAKFPGYLALILQLCTVRDRYWSYVQARRFVNDGGIVICDRFPLSQFISMDGPQIEQLAGKNANQWLIRWMITIENRYYQRFALPEVLAILRLDPALAVQRKAEEPPAFVRARSQEIWETDWQNSGAQVIDAARSKDEVLAELKALLWSNL